MALILLIKSYINLHHELYPKSDLELLFAFYLLGEEVSKLAFYLVISYVLKVLVKLLMMIF